MRAATATTSRSALGTLKISGIDPIAVLADVNTTTIAGTNLASPSQSAVRDQILNGDISGTVNAGVTVNGFGLDVSSSKAGGAVNFVNNGAIVIDNAGANGIAALFLSGNGGGVTYSGTGTISNHADTPNSAGLAIASSGGIGGTNLVEVAGSITGSRGIDTADGTTTIVVTGTVTGTGGTAIFSATRRPTTLSTSSPPRSSPAIWTAAATTTRSASPAPPAAGRSISARSAVTSRYSSRARPRPGP